ncbi:8-hydroxygeraniol dehydrogenase-like protein [Tanacetum coccineum]
MALSPESEHPIKAYGYAARDTSGTLSPLTFSRRATGDKDVRFKVLYCGICHSDLHFAKNEWGMSTYPLVPGHEIVGVVTEVGSKVEKFKVGDKVGVGCLVGSCGSCQSCADDLENYCPKQILTYGFPYYDGTRTYGGYSDHMVAEEHFVLRWPENLPLDSGLQRGHWMIIDTELRLTHPIAPFSDTDLSLTVANSLIAHRLLALGEDALVFWVGVDKLPKESYLTAYEDLRAAFRENYLQQIKHIKDPVEIHHTKQRDGESTEDFMERYKAEVLDVEGAPECMKISGFMHGITHP